MNSNRLSLRAAAMASLLAFAADAKDAKKPAASGLQTPGVRVQFDALKAEAEIQLEAAPAGVVFTNEIVAAAGSKLQRFEAKTNKAGESAPGPGRACGALINAHQAFWTFDCAASALLKLEGKPQKILGKLEAGAVDSMQALAASADSVWLVADSRTSLLRIDPARMAVAADIRLPPGCSALSFAENSLWVGCPDLDKVLRIDPATNLVDKRIDVAGRPSAIAAGEGYIWVHLRKAGKVAQIDPKSNKVTSTIDLGVPDVAATMAFGEGSVWISMPGFPLTRLHAAAAKVVQQFAGAGPSQVFYGLNSVWLANPEKNTLHRFDPKRIAATLAD